MKVFAVLMVTLALASCTQKAEDHLYAGIVVAYVGGKAVDSELLGVALTKEKCENGVKAATASASSLPSDGQHYVLGCAEIVPLASVN